MTKPQNKSAVAAMERFLYLCAGALSIGFGIFRNSTSSDAFPMWKRALVIASGLFLAYCGSMYYFPRNRRRRERLDAFLNEEEREP